MVYICQWDDRKIDGVWHMLVTTTVTQRPIANEVVDGVAVTVTVAVAVAYGMVWYGGVQWCVLVALYQLLYHDMPH
jgi:hypothetical protein